MSATSGGLLFLLAVVGVIALVIATVCGIAAIVYRVKHRDDPDQGT
ncbi:MAG: hypothetical protein ACR2MN_00915 [Acidimicrobiales bacterium]